MNTTITLSQFLAWLVQFGFTSTELLLSEVLKDFKNDKITAEEADLVADGRFSAMLSALSDLRAESIALDEETTKVLHNKFEK